MIDPESKLDAVRNVGIRAGRIEAISDQALTGTRVIDATGLVVAPGFIDLHEHGQNEESYALMVRDGVTSAFELEVGTGDVAKWYDERKQGQIVNYGVSVGHIKARMKVLNDPGTALLPAGVGGSGSATEAQITEMEAILRKGLDDGAVAVGFGSAYTPGATMAEIERMFRVAAARNASSHIHMRNGVAGLDSTIAAAAAAKAKLHIVHANSSGDTALAVFLEHIQAARDRGQDVTTEAYPYGAGMTEIQSALFDDWKTWPDAKFQIHQLVSTGERLNRKTFEEARKKGGTVIIHSRTEEQTHTAIASRWVASSNRISRSPVSGIGGARRVAQMIGAYAMPSESEPWSSIAGMPSFFIIPSPASWRSSSIVRQGVSSPGCVPRIFAVSSGVPTSASSGKHSSPCGPAASSRMRGSDVAFAPAYDSISAAKHCHATIDDAIRSRRSGSGSAGWLRRSVARCSAYAAAACQAPASTSSLPRTSER